MSSKSIDAPHAARTGRSLAAAITAAAIAALAGAAHAQSDTTAIDSIRDGQRVRLVQSGAPTVLRSFRPRDGALQSPADPQRSAVTQIGSAAPSPRIIVADSAARLQRQLANDPTVASRVAGSLTHDGMILIQADARDVRPLIAISPTETLDDRFLDQFRRDHPFVTQPEALRARDAMLAARSQWQRETGLTNRVIRFENADARRADASEHRNAPAIHEPAAIIVPRGQGLMTDAYGHEHIHSNIQYSSHPSAHPYTPTYTHSSHAFVFGSAYAHRPSCAPKPICPPRHSSHFHRNSCSSFHSKGGLTITLSSGSAHAFHGHSSNACAKPSYTHCHTTRRRACR